jgi:hypothetical protein
MRLLFLFCFVYEMTNDCCDDTGLPDFSWYSIPKQKNKPNDHKGHKIPLPNDRQIDQMAMKFSNTLQNLPKLGLV